MSTGRSTGAVMKIGVMVAAVIVVLRIVLEQLGSPERINNIFGVAWLYFILPVLFALGIAAGKETGPFRTLLKNVVLFAVYTRLMVMVTYVIAYFLQWQAPRFSTAMGGNVGQNVGLLTGLLVIPIRNALIWVVFAPIVGMIIGGIVLWLKRKSSRAPAA